MTLRSGNLKKARKQFEIAHDVIERLIKRDEANVDYLSERAAILAEMSRTFGPGEEVRAANLLKEAIRQQASASSRSSGIRLFRERASRLREMQASLTKG